MCNCNNQTYPCPTCSGAIPSCKEGCAIELDSSCVQYTGDPLTNINIETGDWLDEILIKLNSFTFSETIFSANSTNTIVGTANGTNGHSPYYSVRLDPTDNAITQSSTGLKVSLAQIIEGKVKVNSTDTLDYLENQLFAGTDINNIITITPTVVGGAIYLVPSINKTNLLNWISSEICSIASTCVPASISTTTTTTIATTTTTSTAAPTTTTTTTQAPNDFIINNLGGQGIFDITLRDELSLIDYIEDTTTNNSQSSSYLYTGSANESEIVIQKTPSAPIGVNVKVNGSVVYNNTSYIGSLTIPNLLAKSDIEVILYPYVGTTTTTTTSTSTTTTTTAAPCVTYSVSNNTGSSKSMNYTTCLGVPVISVIPNVTTYEVCAIQGTMVVGSGVVVTQINSICSTTTTTTLSCPDVIDIIGSGATGTVTTTTTTTTTTSTSTTTTTTSNPFDTTLTFLSSNSDTEGGITGTIGAPNATTSFKFNLIVPEIGTPANMDLYIGASLFMVVGFSTDYLGQPFRLTDNLGNVYDDVFTNGTITF